MILPEFCGALSGLLSALNDTQTEDQAREQVQERIERVVHLCQQAQQALAEVPDGVGVREFYTRPHTFGTSLAQRIPSQVVTKATAGALESKSGG